MTRTFLILPTALLMSAFAVPSVAAETSTVAGKLVDVATYVTHDHNMDSLHAMKAGSMSEGHMMSGTAQKPEPKSMDGDHMGSAACPPLGIVTDSGRVYLVATQMGVSMGSSLCDDVNSKVVLSGKLYTQGGTTVLLVTAIK